MFPIVFSYSPRCAGGYAHPRGYAFVSRNVNRTIRNTVLQHGAASSWRDHDEEKGYLLSRSSGKTAPGPCIACARIRHRGGGAVHHLNQAFERVAMHGVRKQLLLAQAECVGLPPTTIDLPWPCSNEEYGRIMTGFIADVVAKDIYMAFGDLFLRMCAPIGSGNWRGPASRRSSRSGAATSTELAQAMIDAGLKARVCPWIRASWTPG